MWCRTKYNIKYILFRTRSLHIDPTSGHPLWSTEGFCKCNRAYFGNRCQFSACTDSDGVECSNAGVCVVEVKSVSSVVSYNETCRCSPGRFGSRCEINPCNGVSCAVGKTCVAYERLNNGIKVQGTYCV